MDSPLKYMGINSSYQSYKKEELKFSFDEWKWPLAFMLCMSALGLKFPLAYIFIPLILINRFQRDRYDFIIMLTILSGEYGLISKSVLGFHPYFISLSAAIIGIIVYKKSVIVKKILYACGLYACGIFIFAMLSDETLVIQSGHMIRYISLIYFIIPIICFSSHNFEISIFYRKIMPYCFLMCAWYTLDCFIINGWVFLPCTPLPLWTEQSLFYSPVIVHFGSFPRIYPQGLVILALAIYPIAKYYKLNKWQWALIICAMISCRTFTIITGLILTYALCSSKPKQLLKSGLICIVAFGCLYFIDGKLPISENKQTTLRIKSSIDQLFILQTMEDEEDLAQLGTGRAAQILPKMELLYELNREWIGFGFLHNKKTTMSKYIIENPLYLENVEAEEVAANVEVAVFQHILFIGYIGLMMVIAFYGYILWLIRRQKQHHYVYSIIFCVCWFGISGFGGLTDAYTILLVSLSLSVVLLSNQNTTIDRTQNETVNNNSCI